MATATTIVLLGRSTPGILEDARAAFPKNDVLVISRDGDALTPPDGVPCVPLSEFAPTREEKYILVANGGTTAQCIVVLRRLLESAATFGVVDLQRDGASELWPTMSGYERAYCLTHAVGQRWVSELSKQEAYDLYYHTVW